MEQKYVIFMIVFLIIGITIGYFVSIRRISRLSYELSKITREHDELKKAFNELSERYQSLLRKYSNLNKTYIELLLTYNNLQEKVNKLTSIKECKIEILKDRDYYYAIKNDLRKANKTVIIAMYSIIYDPKDTFDWANDLIGELIKAKKRGLNITIILEYRTHFGLLDDNLRAYEYLLGAGIKVKLDKDRDTDHMKLVIIDEKIVYLGSHNWSESSLHYNHEVSIRVVSESIAKALEEYLKSI